MKFVEWLLEKKKMHVHVVLNIKLGQKLLTRNGDKIGRKYVFQIYFFNQSI